jgi:hypothetical protein
MAAAGGGDDWMDGKPLSINDVRKAQLDIANGFCMDTVSEPFDTASFSAAEALEIFKSPHAHPRPRTHRDRRSRSKRKMQQQQNQQQKTQSQKIETCTDRTKTTTGQSSSKIQPEPQPLRPTGAKATTLPDASAHKAAQWNGGDDKDSFVIEVS